MPAARRLQSTNRKKVTKEINATYAFFYGQVGPRIQSQSGSAMVAKSDDGGGSGDGQDKSKKPGDQGKSGHDNNRASKSIKPGHRGDAGHDSSVGTGQDDGSFKSEEHQKSHTALEMQSTFLELEVAMLALNVALKEMMKSPAKANKSQPTQTFELGNLNKIDETCDELCKISKDGKMREMAELAGRISNLAAGNKMPSSEEHSATGLKTLSIHRETILPLVSYLGQVQLFSKFAELDSPNTE